MVPTLSVLSTLISPPMASTSSLLIAIPRPVPLTLSLFLLRSWLKASKICFRKSALIPMPVSSQRNTVTAFLSSRGSCRTERVTRPPIGVNFAALPTMFISTCLMRTLSPSTQGKGISFCMTNDTPRRSTLSRCMDQIASIRVSTSIGSQTISARPACSLEKSRISFTRHSR